MADLTKWLAATPVATALRDTPWAIPAIQCIHIAAIALLLVSSLIGQLRFAGMMATDEPLGAMAAWLRPRVRIPVAVLLATGLLMIASEPNRTLGNAVFWIKLAVVTAAVALSERLAGLAGSGTPLPRWTAPANLLVLLLWVVAIACGRWIAYLY